MTADGGEIWSAELGCTLVHILGGMVGDFTIEYTIKGHTCNPVHTWSKFGLMVAQDMDPNTPYVFAQASLPGNDDVAVNEKGVKLVTRPERGGAAAPGSGGWAPLEWPLTHKLVRKSDLFTASVSRDSGITYESIAANDKRDNTTLELEDPVVAGFALCGKGSVGGVATATVVRVKINGEISIGVEPSGKLATSWGASKSDRSSTQKLQ